jgi:hypothetical protein
MLFLSFATDCNVSVKQTLGSAWQQEGKNLSQWNVQLTAGSEAVKSLELSITGAKIIQLWELTNQSTGLFALPEYRIQNGGIVAGQTHQFGYIWESSSQATIAVSSINCGSATPSASPAAPSPSTAPASPSASPAAPSASPSAAPSIVATPQPTGCSVSVAQTTRSASAGGSWIDGAFHFQIFDLTFLNNGNQAVNNAQVTITLAAGQEITQSWNIERKSGSTFTTSTTYGPLQVGATLGAGYVLRSAASAGQPAAPAAPAVAIDSVTCAGAPTASPSPAAPSPSAAPASPSASPSAAPTIVATPQPSPANGCSASVTVVARSTAAGGVWVDGGNTFQIFDVSIANNGQRPLNGGVVTFTLAETGAIITQFWELSRQGSTNAFNIAFNYGALQAGATQGAGVVVRLAGSSPAAKPTVTIGSLGCQ